tara:strand:+ start:98 stop:517 length:420 start_codon:yes stop_codon:yes gene_type:complete
MRDKNIYKMIGGSGVLKQLVDSFYDEMDKYGKVETIRNLHPADLQDSKEKLFLFLSGWFGGPDLYVKKFGHPRLKRRHMPFKIGIEEADQWMFCMEKSIQKLDLDHSLRKHLLEIFRRMANHLINDGTKIDFPSRNYNK